MSENTRLVDGKSRLMRATLSCLAEFGHQGTTVRRVAERAQVTPGLVRHHFSSKNALLVEVYRHINQVAIARMARALDQGGNDIDDALETVIGALFPEDMRNVRQMRVMVAFWSLVLTEADLAAVQREINERFHAQIIFFIEIYFSQREDAAEIASGIIGIADGLWLECCLNPERMTPERAIQTALKFSRACLKI